MDQSQVAEALEMASRYGFVLFFAIWTVWRLDHFMTMMVAYQAKQEEMLRELVKRIEDLAELVVRELVRNVKQG